VPVCGVDRDVVPSAQSPQEPEPGERPGAPFEPHEVEVPQAFDHVRFSRRDQEVHPRSRERALQGADERQRQEDVSDAIVGAHDQHAADLVGGRRRFRKWKDTMDEPRDQAHAASRRRIQARVHQASTS